MDFLAFVFSSEKKWGRLVLALIGGGPLMFFSESVWWTVGFLVSITFGGFWALPWKCGGEGDGYGESDSLFISSRRFDGALVLDE